jgi:hypothetical protein
MRTVSFFGWTLPVSFFGGMAPAGAFGILGIFGFSAIYQLLIKLNFTAKGVNQHFPWFIRGGGRLARRRGGASRAPGLFCLEDEAWIHLIRGRLPAL